MGKKQQSNCSTAHIKNPTFAPRIQAHSQKNVLLWSQGWVIISCPFYEELHRINSREETHACTHTFMVGMIVFNFSSKHREMEQLNSTQKSGGGGGGGRWHCTTNTDPGNGHEAFDSAGKLFALPKPREVFPCPTIDLLFHFPHNQAMLCKLYVLQVITASNTYP